MGYRSKNAIVVLSDLRAAEVAALAPPQSGFTFVTVTADYDLADGIDPVGTVSFTPSQPMVNDDTIVAAPVTRALDIDGILLIDLAANTDPLTTPTGTFYTVTESINGVSRTYQRVVPYNAGSPVNLTDLEAP